jgi:hypothetical protein
MLLDHTTGAARLEACGPLCMRAPKNLDMNMLFAVGIF